MYMHKRSFQEIAFDAFNIFVMLGLVMFTLYPFIYVLLASLSDSAQVIQSRGMLFLPKGLNFHAYSFAFKHPMLTKGYINTISYAAAGTIIGLFIMSLAAYVFSREDFPGKKFFMLLIVFTMFFGGGLIPTYINIRNLGLHDTRLVMFLPSCLSTWSIIIMRTGFKQVPLTLSESAFLDGANDFTILIKIILPLSKAVIAVVTLFSIVGYWNSWFPALIYLNDRSKYPLQMIMREILILGRIDELQVEMAMDTTGDKRAALQEVIKYAITIITIGPIIFAYPFAQKYFIRGVLIGSLKE